MLGQHKLMWWLGSVSQHAIIFPNVEQNVCRHIALLGHHKLNLISVIFMSILMRLVYPITFIWTKIILSH